MEYLEFVLQQVAEYVHHDDDVDRQVVVDKIVA